ncbi:S-layer homology domain-containing protein [Paenibacillus puldeungensis]|uniref:S-layer homology domain-containing protein n=1 Tax=Paenibacillus puldeungensis TaxID=696536 RepID=A0ABW3S4M6_9BACL
MKKKWLSLFLSTVILGSTLFTGGVSAANGSTTLEDKGAVPTGKATLQTASAFTDLSGHWAKAVIEKWQHRGIVQGDVLGKFDPNRSLTRSEWVALVNRIFQLNDKTDRSFRDVQAQDWFAKDVQSAAAAGYIKGDQDGNFNPNAPLTREQAAVTLDKLLKLQNTENTVTKSFKDASSLAKWSTSSVYAAVDKGLLRGYKDQTFRPSLPLTRAEAVTLLDRATEAYGAWYGEAGVYGPEATDAAKGAGQADSSSIAAGSVDSNTKSASSPQKIDGSVIINAPDITLQNTEITGNLIIGKGVGEGDVNLSNVTVHGSTYVYGGGENSIHVDNSVLVNIIVNKNDGTVRIVAKGKTAIQEVVVQTGANLEAAKGVQVSKVSLTNELPADSKVRLAGYFNTVNVEAYSVALDIPEGSIGELNVSPEAGGTTMETGKEASILSLVLNAAAKVTGLGEIKNAIINTSGSSFDQAPTKIKVGDQVSRDAKLSIGGKEVNAGEAAAATPAATSTPASTGSTSGSSGGSSSSGGGNSGGDTGNPSNGSHWIQVNLEKKAVSVGEAVYFTSSQDGTAYLVSDRIAYFNPATLQLAVDSGEALQMPVKAGVRSYFDTDNLNNVRYPSNYEFYVVVYNSVGNHNAEEVIVLNETEHLDPSPVLTHHGTDPEYFSINYNRLVQLTPGRSAEEIVELALNGSDSFVPFNSSLGTVQIVGNKVMIRPIQSKLGKNFRFRLKKGAVITGDGQSNTEFVTGAINSFIGIAMISHGGKSYATVKIGESIQFSVEDEATVYLMPEYIQGSKDSFDKKVTEGWGKKIEVSAAEVGKMITILTEGLSPGRYNLHVWSGHSVLIELIK